MFNMLSRLSEMINGTNEVGNNAPKGYSYNAGTQSFSAKAKGGKVSSASARADGIAQRGKTRGTMVMCGGGYAKGKK
jgi:hypothetical protein